MTERLETIAASKRQQVDIVVDLTQRLENKKKYFPDLSYFVFPDGKKIPGHFRKRDTKIHVEFDVQRKPHDFLGEIMAYPSTRMFNLRINKAETIFVAPESWAGIIFEGGFRGMTKIPRKTWTEDPTQIDKAIDKGLKYAPTQLDYVVNKESNKVIGNMIKEKWGSIEAYNRFYNELNRKLSLAFCTLYTCAGFSGTIVALAYHQKYPAIIGGVVTAAAGFCGRKLVKKK